MGKFEQGMTRRQYKALIILPVITVYQCFPVSLVQQAICGRFRHQLSRGCNVQTEGNAAMFYQDPRYMYNHKRIAVVIRTEQENKITIDK